MACLCCSRELQAHCMHAGFHEAGAYTSYFIDACRSALFAGLGGLLAAAAPAALAADGDSNGNNSNNGGGGGANSASSRMSYSRFLEYLDMGRVKKVDLYENGTIAIVEAVSPELGNRVQRVRVQLPGTSRELLDKFRAKKVDFAAHTNSEDGGAVFANLLGNLAFPLLLVGGLFLLSRRGGGGGGMGGGNNPMSFGKSKAKFQMEPNTGVTFDDVAGVEEAKRDFMEIVEFLKKPEKFTAVGAKIPKGALLVGPPGTGALRLAVSVSACGVAHLCLRSCLNLACACFGLHCRAAQIFQHAD